MESVEQLTRSELDEASKRGAAWLDKGEEQWALRANPDELSMGSCFNCVLGQLAGDFSYGRDRYGVKGYDLTVYLGFTLPQPTSQPQHVWDQLTECWRERIRERIPPREEA